MTKKIVIYHGSCPDGFGAAVSAWLALGDEAEYLAVDHGEPAPDVTGKEVFIVDFAFGLAETQRMDAQADSLVILDHHETSMQKLHGFRCRCGGFVFDMGKSGARLAWEYFHPGNPVPSLVAHIEDRDLFKWELEASRPFLAELDKLPYDFQVWKRVLEMSAGEYSEFIKPGVVAHEKYMSLCHEIAKDARPIELDGQAGLQVNCHPVFVDDVGQILFDRTGTFAAMWHVGTHPSIKVSLRAGPGFRVKELAEAFGGGGHPRSAAFRLPLTRFDELSQGRVLTAESVPVN
ncbi:DHHA1 domain-containing protein [Burkholderia cenocepacia]|uniref:DHHA1 domain-containing protein n=1 Tax=Burkholderia cenocepacia TaxID=95486 RepID=UPI0007612D02|nr:DHHA1 domain-containing protein [Burkholderia cenocepacia]KWU17942.1 hypothetical protein AS149_14810 [Burkholderia cenocepacia]